MNKGILYIMSTVVPGLIKIGQTTDFEKRMNFLESNGYRNVVGLKREFAIEVDDYTDKEKLLHTLFAKSRVSDTELFAVDINMAIQLLSSFEGVMIYPKSQTKELVFEEAVDNSNSQLIPNGTYYFDRQRQDEPQTIRGIAEIEDGKWTLKKGSVLALKEGVGNSNKSKSKRLELQIDNEGRLLEDVELGEVSPSMVGGLVIYASCNGWLEWKDKDGKAIDYWRKKK